MKDVFLGTGWSEMGRIVSMRQEVPFILCSVLEMLKMGLSKWVERLGTIVWHLLLGRLGGYACI